jgi:hypothetical protein
MHIWHSPKVLKTNKSWEVKLPKGLSNEDVKNLRREEREYKHTMLGIVTKEKKTTGKSNSRE